MFATLPTEINPDVRICKTEPITYIIYVSFSYEKRVYITLVNLCIWFAIMVTNTQWITEPMLDINMFYFFTRQ